MKKVSVYEGLNDKYYREELPNIIEGIKNGESKNLVDEIRSYFAAGKKEQAEEAMKKLKWFTPSGILDEELCGDPILEYAGLVTIEIAAHAPDLHKLIYMIEAITTTYCWFHSLDVNKITILVAVDSDSCDHESAFFRVGNFYAEALDKQVEPGFIFITKPCYFSYSPHLYLNPNCAKFEIFPDEYYYEPSND